MIQRNHAQRCIAIDISSPSLKKAERLIQQIGAQEQIETRLGDGLTALKPEEADAIAILGMGGTLIAQILDVLPPLMGAKRCVLQPMRGAEDIRFWLYARNYPVLEDRVVLDAGRYYQVFSVGAPEKAPQALPEGWPEDCFLLGYRAFQAREPMMKPLVEQLLATTNRKLRTQRAGCAASAASAIGTNFDAMGAKTMKIQEFTAVMERIAPRDLALEFDNPGILIEPDHEEITRVLVALDCTTAVAKEAVELGVDLVVTHHPLFFHPVKHMAYSDPATKAACMLLRHGIGLFSAHTNLDAAHGGRQRYALHAVWHSGCDSV